MQESFTDQTKQSQEESPGSGKHKVSLKSVLLFTVAAVLVLVFVNNQISARNANNSGFSLFGSCCGSGSAVSQSREEQMRQDGLSYYRTNYGDGDVEAVVEDYGCHQEIHIYAEGQLVKRLNYSNGKVYELPQ